MLLLNESRRETQNLINEWVDVIEDEGSPVIQRQYHAAFAQLMENYSKIQKSEGSQLAESTQTGDVAKFDPVLVPIIRRSFPQLIAMDIFGMQPMNGPTGLLFCIKPQFHNTTALPIKATNSYILELTNGAAFAKDGDISSATHTGKVRHIEGNWVIVEVLTGTFSTAFTATTSVDNAGTYSSAETTVKGRYPNEAMYHHLFAEYMKFADVATAETATTSIRELGFSVEKTTAIAGDYKLKVKLTDELIQDMNAVHNINAEAELINFATNEVIAEQNRTFISYLNTKAIAGGNTSFTMSSADGRWEVEKIWNMYSYMNRIGNGIAKTTLRGGANFAVVSLDVASKLEMLSNWHAAPGLGGIRDINLGQNAFVGNIGGKYNVYVDLYANSDYINLGYKGASAWDNGIYYAPYVPLYIKKTIGEESGQPHMFFNTRYAVVDNPFGAHLYYRNIAVTL